MDDIVNIPDSEFAPSGNSPGKQKWVPVSLQASGLNLVGGYQGKYSAALPVKTKSFDIAGRDVTFVQISKNEAWLLRAAGGIGTVRGSLTRSKAIEQLREKAAVADMDGSVPPPSEEEPVPPPVERDDYDPMNQLDAIEDHNESPEKKQGKDHM